MTVLSYGEGFATIKVSTEEANMLYLSVSSYADFVLDEPGPEEEESEEEKEDRHRQIKMEQDIQPILQALSMALLHKQSYEETFEKIKRMIEKAKEDFRKRS